MMAAAAASTSQSETIQRNIQDARSSLQTAISQLGLVLRFHRDVKALGVESYAAKAPGSITRPLAQAIKDYNDACDAMELELMKAKRILVHDTTSADTPAHIKSEEAESSAAAGLASGTEQNTDPSHPAYSKPDRKPILLEDDEMEDLFGSGNSTSISSPITALNQAASTAQPALKPPNAESEPTGQSALNLDASSGMGGDTQMDSTNLGLNLGDLNEMGSKSTNADFSSMSANDFNNLLASLGAGGSGQQQGGGDDLLGDLNAGNIDFSSFGSLFDGTGGAS